MKKNEYASIANEYLIYARKSTDDQEHQKNSIEYQVMHCRKFADDVGLRIADYSEEDFCDNGIVQESHTAFKTSGLEISPDGSIQYNIDRPRFQRLVALLASGKFKGVICLCWDRLSRNPHDDAVAKYLHDRGVDIRFVLATYDNSSSGALHMAIDGVFASFYSRNVSEKVTLAIAKLRLEGKRLGKAPIGYLNRGSGNKPLDRERAPVVKKLFELYATGEWSIAQLAQWAKKQGLTSQGKLRKKISPEGEKANPVLPRTIELLLHNPFYAGFLRHDGVEYPAVHKALISRELFDQVQLVHRKRTTSVHYAEELPYCYRGLIRCSCGRSYSPYLQKSYVYYGARCRGVCGNPIRNLSEKKIDAAFQEILGRIHFTKEETTCLKDRAPHYFAEASQKRNDTGRIFEKQRNRLMRDLQYLEDNKIDLLRERAFTPADIAKEMGRLRVELKDIKSKATDLIEVDEQTKFETVMSFSELIISAKSALKNADRQKTRHLFTTLFTELVLDNGIVASYSAKPGIEKLLKRPSAKLSALGGSRTPVTRFEV